ncbi:hypothetical protein SUGI_0502760 [Cryptomeria japonica]|nr:hypothetical protein SUGI_0502760 [Cryptomeria japonica]
MRVWVSPYSYSAPSILGHVWKRNRSGSRSRSRVAIDSATPAFCGNVETSNALPPKRYPEYNRLLPCPRQNEPPRIEHLVMEESGNVVDHICEKLDLPPFYVADLIHFGAVHCALVCPKPPSTASAQQIRLFKQVTAPTILKKRPSLKGKTIREAQNTFRITSPNEYIEAGSYLRVHVHPKRFPRCYEVDWASRVIAETDSYVVLDKPVGISVGGTTDNIEETCTMFTTRAMKLSSPLRTTHQLDNCTEGCVVLSKTVEFCAEFHTKLREKQVKKLYLALTAAPVPPGKISHYMCPDNFAPRILSKEPFEGWRLCQLEVLECKEVPWPDTAIEATYGIRDCGWSPKDVAYECKIKLLTGRTHQIRAQLAACGSPIIGDSIYMLASIKMIMSPHLYPFAEAESKKNVRNSEAMNSAIHQWKSQHGKEPDIAIGLQACEISWNDGECTYQAGLPWWRSN